MAVRALQPRLRGAGVKRRWVVEWAGRAQLYGFTLAVGDPIAATAWTRRGAERKMQRVQDERLIQGGSAGAWRVRRA